MDPICVLTIYGAADMVPKEREELAKWLHEQAYQLVDEGANYADRFRAKYYEGGDNENDR